MVETNQTFENVMQTRGMLSEGLMDQIAKEGTLANIDDIPDDVKRVFVCAHDIEPQWHVRMQAAFQKHCDSSISKTINFSHDADPADVDKIYRMAFDLRCKGVTVYRDGCRAGQPMALSDSEKRHHEMNDHGDNMNSPTDGNEPSSEKKDDAQRTKIRTETNLFGERITTLKKPAAVMEPRELPPITSGIRIRQQTPFGNMHIQITVDPKSEREMEVFAQLGKGGDLATSDLEAICRMISLWLRAGGSLRHVIKQLSGIGSSLQIPTRHGRIMSLGDGLAHALKRYTRAKECHGLKALLLGEVDPADLEADPVRRGPNGGSNGGSSGNGNGEGGADNARVTADPLSAERLSSGPPAERRITSRHQYRIKCPECGGDLDMGEGCSKCHSCGFAQC